MIELIKCDVCGGSVANDAKVCPHCGHPLKDSKVASLAKAMMIAGENFRRSEVRGVSNEQVDARSESLDAKTTQDKTPMWKRIFYFVIGFLVFEWISVFLRSVFDFLPTPRQDEVSMYLWPIICTFAGPIYTTIPFLALMKIWGLRAVSVSAFIIAMLAPGRLASIMRELAPVAKHLHWTAESISAVLISMCVIGSLWGLYFMFAYRMPKEKRVTLIIRLTTYAIVYAAMCFYSYMLWDMY